MYVCTYIVWYKYTYGLYVLTYIYIYMYDFTYLKLWKCCNIMFGLNAQSGRTAGRTQGIWFVTI